MADITPITNLRGPAARITGVSAEAVPAGDDAEVVMTGPDQNRQFQFKVPRGLPGVNAIENDEAVAAYVGAVDSDTRTALDAVIDGATTGMVTSGDVQTIRITETPGDVPAAGEVLFRLQPPETWFTDFSTDTVGVMPAGWQRKWNVGLGLATVVELGGAQVFQVSGFTTGSSSPGGFTHPDLTAVLHGAVRGEIALKYRANGSSSRVCPTFLASGDTASEYCYYSGVRNIGAPGQRVEASKFVDGTRQSPFAYSADTVAPGPGVDYTIVHRWEGIFHYVKWWADGSPEPAEWQVVGHDDLITEGEWAGFSIHNSASQYLIHWVGVSRTEAPAPRGS